MRYKEKRRAPEELYPIRVDVTDLEALIESVGGVATIEVETSRCEFDGIDDVLKNLKKPTRLEQLTLRFPVAENERGSGSSIEVVPQVSSRGAIGEAMVPVVRSFLRNVKRPRRRKRSSPAWLSRLHSCSFSISGEPKQ